MTSKQLGIDDISGFEFVKEILHGDPTFAINFDRIQWDNKYNQYVIVEFLLCEEAQLVSPFTSHPNRYFLKNKHKFISLWEMSEQFNARLYLVNYAKKGTRNDNEVLFMYVNGVNENNAPNFVDTDDYQMTREEFSERFRAMNNRGKK